MVAQKTEQRQNTRRDFLKTTTLLVAGGVLSCSTNEPGADLTPKKSHGLPKTLPQTIRVRIGKIRAQKTVIDNEPIAKTKQGWITGLNGFTQSGEKEFVYQNQKPISVLINTETKQISGTLVFVARESISETAYDIVAHVNIETYLPGVLAGELYAHWHPTTFAAQAIAARSYAANQHIERVNRSHFDVEDGPSSQMFLGDVSLKVAHQAVNETRGRVLVWDNNIIPAYYCACCGGVAATATDAISGAALHKIPPLEGRSGNDVCQKLDIHKWRAVRSSRTLRKRLNTYAPKINHKNLNSLRSIRTIEPSKTNVHGRAIELTIYDRRKTPFVILAKDFIRATNMHVQNLPDPLPIIWSSNLRASKQGSKTEILGVGMGHGVGLCQYGAQELASLGKTWEEILNWYYPGAQIV